MTRSDALRFAEQWADAWNRRDMEAVLAGFEDDVVFTSPRAFEVVGVATVRGKQALRAYWSKALAEVTSLRFTLDRVVWDPESRELAIIYRREVNGAEKRVSENLRFNKNGRITAAEVFHGVASRSS